MKTSAKIVNAILNDLSDRSGIGDSLNEIDDDTMKELKFELRSIIETILNEEQS